MIDEGKLAEFGEFKDELNLNIGIENCINKCAEERGLKWRVSTFDFLFDGAEYGESDEYELLSLKVHNKIPMADGIRKMSLIAENNPSMTENDVAVDFEMDKAVEVEIKNMHGLRTPPRFRIVNMAEIRKVIEDAVKWLAECEREYDGGSEVKESAGHRNARMDESVNGARVDAFIGWLRASTHSSDGCATARERGKSFAGNSKRLSGGPRRAARIRRSSIR